MRIFSDQGEQSLHSNFVKSSIFNNQNICSISFIQFCQFFRERSGHKKSLVPGSIETDLRPKILSQILLKFNFNRNSIWDFIRYEIQSLRGLRGEYLRV